MLIILTSIDVYAIDLNFKNYKAEDGLSSNTIYAVLQDSRGFMWFGTEDGLNRFDGYEFISYRNTPRNSNSLINNYVYCLAEDNHQNIWIGTERGVCTLNYITNSFSEVTQTTSDGVAITERIQNLIFDNDKIWIASSRQGVFVVDDDKMILHSFNEFRENIRETIWVSTIYKDKENTIWALVSNTKHEIYRYDTNSNSFIPAFIQMRPEERRSLGGYTMLQDSYGTLWFGTWSNGLIAVDKSSSKIIGRYLNNAGKDKISHIHQLTEYNPGTILIGSNYGLTSFKSSPSGKGRCDQQLVEPDISNRFVYPIYKDREGGLWVGTFYGGINYASPNRNYLTGYSHVKYENSITGNVVSTFCEDKAGNIWIGTEDGGLNKFEPKTGKFTAFNNLGKNSSGSFDNIHALLIDNNNLWIGTYSDGLYIMHLDNNSIKHYLSYENDTTTIDTDNIYSLTHDKNNNIWIGTTKGISRYDRSTDSFTRVLELNEIVMDIKNIDNTLWFATINKGLYRYDTQANKWINYQFDKNNSNSIISNDIITLCVDQNQQLWVGTNNGLCRYYAKNDIFIDEEVPFPSNYICKIFADDDNLWITTLKGLICYTPSTKHYRQFNKSDGLLSDLFTPNSGFRASSGRIYIGTPNGFNTFIPQQLVENSITPSIEVTNFQLFNKKADINKFASSSSENINSITLAHNQNSFSFEFTALSFFAPEKNRYKFMLEGFDKDWLNPGIERKATYTNIPAGQYLFRIMASNNDGVWNEDGYTLEINVKPPFWWTWWSISLYIIAVVSGIGYLFYYYRQRDNKRNEERINKLKSDQEREANESKIEFFTNVAHEIRTPLSLIIAPLGKVMGASQVLPTDIKENLNIMKNNSNRLLTLVNQLLDFSKIERRGIQVSLSQINIHELLNNTYNRFKPTIEQNHIQFVFNADDSNFEAVTDPENITKLISNLLSNASKYTKNHIKLRLNTNYSDENYEISVTDNGPGLPLEEEERIFKPFYQVAGQHKSGTGIGLYLVRSIVDALNGKLKVVNQPGSSFSISVVLPKNVKAAENTPMQRHVSEPQVESEEIVIETNTISEPIDYENKNKSLLIVEDNKELQTFIKNHFTTDYTVYTANDGQEGITVLENHEIDVIISDVMMPNMDGTEFCNTVKNNFLWSHIPIIMLTAKADVNSKIEAFETGADAYIEKPFNMSYLSTRIRNLIENRRLLFQKFTQTPHASLKSIAGNKVDEEFLVKINEIIERNIDNPDFQIEDMAKEIGISSSGLFAKIKQISGETPNKLIQSMRLKKAAELLGDGSHRVNEVCYMVGFNNPSYFAKCFQKQFGKLPKDYV